MVSVPNQVEALIKEATGVTQLVSPGVSVLTEGDDVSRVGGVAVISLVTNYLYSNIV
jgi:hypothetical protein